jgi:hypothetical protein
MTSTKPINIGNARTINEICSPVIKLSMTRFEAIFDFYSEEPYLVNVHINPNEDSYKLEQILRIRRWGVNNESYSWCIFSQKREWQEDANSEKDSFKGLIIRKVVWDMNTDIERIRNRSSDTRQNLNESWPSIYTNNIYLNHQETTELINRISELDKMIESGIILNSNKNPVWSWKDFEVRRLFDWGQIHSTWSPIKQNSVIETKINELDEYFNTVITKSYSEINAIDLDYSINPDMYKNIVTGKYN